MGFLTKLDNGFTAFKSAFSDGFSVPPLYAQLNDGTHSYNYETERFGILGLLGIGQPYKVASQNMKYYYKNTLFLQDCINLYADFASQVKIQEIDEKGNAIENSEYCQFLRNPNAWQNQQELIKELVINTLTSGIMVQSGNFFKNGNLRVSPQLYNLEFSNLAFPEIKNRYALKRKDIEDLTVKEFLADGKKRNLHLYELAIFYDTIPLNGFGTKGYDASNFLNPISRLFSVQTSLETLINTQSSMAYMSGNNVNKVLSPEVSPLAPTASDQKHDIERKLNGRDRYGARQGKVGDVISASTPLKALDLTRDNKKMQMVEMKESAKEDVRNCLLIPKDFFGDSTYENKQQSETRFILGQVKSITDAWLTTLVNKTPGYFETRKTRLIGTYDHLPSVSETKTKSDNAALVDRANAMNTIISTYQNMQAVEQGITWEQFLIRHQFSEFLKVGA